MTTGNTSDSAVVGNRAKTHQQGCATLCDRVRACDAQTAAFPSPFAGIKTHLCSRIARAAGPSRAAWPPFIFFAGRRSRSHAGCSSSQSCPPPASSPKINAGPSSRGPEAPSPPIRGSGGERRAFVPQQNRINLHQISQATARGPRGSYVTAVTLVERVSAL